MTVLVAWIALVWWGAAMLLFGLSVLAALVFPWPWRGGPPGDTPPLTAIVPVKDIEASFDAAQRSLFEQDYPGLEISIASAQAQSPALSAAEAIRKRCPDVASDVVISSVVEAASPKLNTIWTAIEQARHDLVLTKDSNTLLAPGDVACFVHHFRPGVGLVNAIPILISPQSPAAWVEAAAVNGHYARILALARALGMGFGVGKCMLFRRSDLARGGGLSSIAWALGEDSAIADLMSALGLRTVLVDRFIHQSAGQRSWTHLWNRLLRWKLIWRVQRPSAFIGSLFNSALLAALAGALAAPLMGVSPIVVAGATLLVWIAAESLMCSVRGWPLSFWSPIALLQREVLEPLVWLRALTTSEVDWGGGRRRCERPRPVKPAAGEAGA